MGWRASMVLLSPSPRNGISHGGTCSTASRTGSTGRPASSTSVWSPRCVRSFAAQPPVMPEPTTIASKSCCSVRVRGIAVVAPRQGPVSELAGFPDFRRVVPPDREVLEHGEPVAFGRLVVEALDDRGLLRVGLLEEPLIVELGQTRQEALLLRGGIPVGEHRVDEPIDVCVRR